MLLSLSYLYGSQYPCVYLMPFKAYSNFQIVNPIIKNMVGKNTI